jgi:hypothetical protein
MSSNDKKDIERRIEGYVPRDIPTPVWEETLRPFVIPASTPRPLLAWRRWSASRGSSPSSPPGA